MRDTGRLDIRRRNQRGQALLMLTISIATMFAMVGLVVDVGWAYFKKQAAQSAAESAALAAAADAVDRLKGGATFNCGKNGLGCQNSGGCPSVLPNTPANNLDVGCIYAGANGFVTGGNRGRQNVIMSAGINAYAPTAAGAKVSYWVTARIAESTPQLFSAVLGNYVALPAARATAGITISDTCVYILDPVSKSAFSVEGTSDFNSKCGIMIKSSDPQAMILTGNACVTATAIRITGGWSTSSSCPPKPTPVTGALPMPDPLASLRAPSVPACGQMNYKTNTGGTLNPGVYCGGISLTGGTLNLSPGTYILNGGGLKITGGATLLGKGVTIYNTGDGSWPYSPIAIAGGTHIELSAPTSGSMEGILFFQDRTVSSSALNTITGDDTSQFVGALYFPTTPLKFAGNSASTDYSIIVAYNLAIAGRAAINNNYSSLASGGPLKTATLIE